MSKELGLNLTACVLCLNSNDDSYGNVCIACSRFAVDVIGGVRPLDSPDARYFARIVRRGGNCYLCGEDSDLLHADHVYPKSKGGSNHWSNIGAACERCNLSKHDQVLELSSEQQGRLDEQHEGIRDAFRQVDTDTFWKVFMTDSIEFEREHLVEGIEDDGYCYFERDDAEFNLSQEIELFPLAPDWLLEWSVEQVFRGFDPAMWDYPEPTPEERAEAIERLRNLEVVRYTDESGQERMVIQEKVGSGAKKGVCFTVVAVLLLVVLVWVVLGQR